MVKNDAMFIQPQTTSICSCLCVCEFERDFDVRG